MMIARWSLISLICLTSTFAEVAEAQDIEMRCSDAISFSISNDAVILDENQLPQGGVHADWSSIYRIVLTVTDVGWSFSGDAGVELFSGEAWCQLPQTVGYFKKIEIFSPQNVVQMIGIGVCQNQEGICNWREIVRPN